MVRSRSDFEEVHGKAVAALTDGLVASDQFTLGGGQRGQQREAPVIVLNPFHVQRRNVRLAARRDLFEGERTGGITRIGHIDADGSHATRTEAGPRGVLVTAEVGQPVRTEPSAHRFVPRPIQSRIHGQGQCRDVDSEILLDVGRPVRIRIGRLSLRIDGFVVGEHVYLILQAKPSYVCFRRSERAAHEVD